MRRVAGETSLISLDRGVLKDEWPHSIGVALGANRKLAGGRADLTAALGPVRVVTVTALNQPYVHAMAVRPGKLRLLRSMTAIAKLGLRLHEHEIHIGGFVWIMAARAGHTAGQMLGLGEILRFQA